MNERKYQVEGYGDQLNTAVYDGPSYLRFSKNFFSRPTASGFKEALGQSADYTIPGFKNDDMVIVCTDNTFKGFEWYLQPSFHIALCLVGLGGISVGIIMFRLPSMNAQGVKLKFSKILLQ